jgi:hypothetical protein
VAQAPLVLPGAHPPVQHHAPVASYEMTDLREDINRCRGREGSRTTIKCNHERHRDIEGQNLERDFDLHAPGGARQVLRGCMALAPHLRMVVWLPLLAPLAREV